MSVSRMFALVAVAFAIGVSSRPLSAETLSYRGVRVEHDFADKSYAKAIARIVAYAARQARALGYDMPDQFLVNATVKSGGETRLSTTGDFQIRLLLAAEKQLLSPKKSGINHVYGFAHEVGHCCMYRIIKERPWMNTGATEGWATYYGAWVLDGLLEEYGAELWPDAYDYSRLGLSKSVKRWRSSRDEIHRGAYHWSKLVGIVGEKGVAELFRAIQDAGLDAFAADAEMRKLLAGRKKHGKQLAKWWKGASKDLLTKLTRSEFETETIECKQLAEKPETLQRDSGKPAKSMSWPGDSGAAVSFRVKAKDLYLTEVHVYGQRYGRKTDDSFFIWLLDDEFKPIRKFAVPYEDFEHGDPHWEKIAVKPTRVPKEFYVCVVYHAASTKGVYRYHDGESSGESFTGVPGESSRSYAKGDWLIRAVVDKRRR